MNIGYLLSEFVSIVGDVFTALFNYHYIGLLLAVCVALGCSVVVFVVRWLSGA